MTECASCKVFWHLGGGRVLGEDVVEVADGHVSKPLDEKLRAKREQPTNSQDFHPKAKAKTWWDCLCCAIFAEQLKHLGVCGVLGEDVIKVADGHVAV